MVETLIQGGTVVTPTDTIEADVAIDGERIVAVGDSESMPEPARTIDATGRS